MNALKPFLDQGLRGFRPSPDAYGATLDRVDRRQRNRRISSAMVALGIAVAVIVPTLQLLGGQERVAPAHMITPSTVSNLRAIWSDERGISFTPVISDGTVYVGGSGLSAYPLVCGGVGHQCPPLWSGDPGHPTAVPAVTDGIVYISEIGRNSTGPGRLLAFPSSCGTDGARCRPLWWADTGGVALPGVPPIVVGKAVYTATSKGVFAFSTDCAGGGAECQPMWRGVINDAVPTATVELDGTLWVGTAGHGVFLFKNSCGTGGAVCHPIGRELPGAGVSAMSASQNAVYVTSGGVTGLPASCATDPGCKPVFERPNIDAIGGAGSSNGTVFVRHDPGLVYALPAVCPDGTTTCPSRWLANVREPLADMPLAFADDVVFVGSGAGKVYAFPTSCPQACRPAWTAQVGSGGAGIAVSGTTVVVGTADGVHAFSPGPPAVPQGSGGSASTLLFYGAALLLAALLLLVRFRRPSGTLRG